MQTRYLFVVGGVMSGIGKGIAASAMARILKDRGLRVAPIKIDPYINIDAGTMSPLEHGEVFVTEDGMECDQDIGNYERFLGEPLAREHSITTGQIYQTVITKERNLAYEGKNVEVVPDIPNEVIRRIRLIEKKRKADIVLVEIGGTVGDYQNILFLEAARLLRLQEPERSAVILVSYLPVPQTIGEMKTKPTQQAVRALQAAGLQPDFIIARGTTYLDHIRKRKLSIFCNVPEQHIISSPDVSNIYAVPELYEKERFSAELLSFLDIPKRSVKFRGISPSWHKLVLDIERSKRPVRIGIVGKYFTSGTFTLADAYLSVIESLKHSAWTLHRKPELVWIDAEAFENDPKKVSMLRKFEGVVVPGGFGTRGVEGIIKAIQFAREKKIPFLGLCYGLQLAVVEFARHAANMRKAHTTEVDPKTLYPVVDLLPGQNDIVAKKKYGGTLRLGLFPCSISPDSIASKAYRMHKNGGVVTERHRHRYEINNLYRAQLEKKGLRFSGFYLKQQLAEIAELPIEKHPFFLGTQFHPEFQSNPLRPHPLFLAFMKTAAKRK